MDAIFTYISENYPTIAIFIVGIIIGGFVVRYHISIQSTRKKVDALPCNDNTKKLDTLETRVERLPCDAHGKKLDVLETKVDNLQSDMVVVKSDMMEVKKDIVVLKTDVSGIKSDISGIRFLFENVSFIPASKRKSPVSLSDLGEKIASDYNISAIVDRNWNRISAAIKELGSTNPYDIQEFSRETAFTDSIRTKASKFFTENDIDKLRVIAYKSGENIYSISFIAGILIRDRYFAENGIDVDEVDEYHQTIENAENIS